MFEVRLSEMGAQGWRIHFGIDFLIADALSLYIFWSDLYRLYSGELLPPIEVTFKDYLHHQSRVKNDAGHASHKRYWMERLGQFPGAPAIPVKPLKQAAGERSFKRLKQWIDAESWGRFKRSAAQQGLTSSAALLTLYAEVLSAWGGGKHFAVMLTTFSREAVHPQINQVIGDFTQLTLLEIHRQSQPVGENGLAIQARMQADLAHNTYPAVDFVRELNKLDASETKQYPFVFTSALGVEAIGESGRTEGFLSNVGWSISSTPQVWIDHQVFNERSGISLSWDTLQGLFPPGMVEAMFEKYVEMVQMAVADTGFWQKTLLEMRTESQRKVQEEANRTIKDIALRPIHQAVCDRRHSDPDRLAVIFENRGYSYRQLLQRADRVSGLLQHRGTVKGQLVALQMAKSVDQIAVVLGILQIGAVYVPLPFGQPGKRTDEVLEMAEVKVLFTDERLKLDNPRVTQLTPIDLDRWTGDWQAVEVDPEALAYVIFTSGSSGTPKGVSIQHRAVANTIIDVNNKLRITSKDRVLGLSSLSFDLSVYDIFGLLGAGAALVLPTEAERIDPKCWRRLVENHEVTIWNSVPALMNIYTDFLLSKDDAQNEITLQKIILSGDWIPLGLPDAIARTIPNATLISMGGATEASIWSNYYVVNDVDQEWVSIPYGYPLSNQSFYILDAFGRQCPDWIKGRLHIAGKGLARGYLKQPELTDRAFFDHPDIGCRLYDTGDYGRYMAEGVIEFLGREDNQLKINGYRIEAGEIEAALRKLDASLEPLILPLGDKMQNKKLIAFVKHEASSFSETDLKNRLKSYLPSYFIPERVIPLDAYPMTPNGKIDRNALLENLQQHPSPAIEEDSSEIRGAGQQVVLKIVRQALALPQLSESDEFADMGVSSVDMIRLANELEANFSDRPSVGEMVQYRSVGELIAYYRDVEMATVAEPRPSPSFDPRFSLYSEDQISYLRNLPGARPGGRIASRLSVTSRRTALKANPAIDLEIGPVANEPVLSGWRNTAERSFEQPITLSAFKQCLALLTRLSTSSDEPAIQLYVTVFDGGIEDFAPGSYYLDAKGNTLRGLYKTSLNAQSIADEETEWDGKAAFAVHFIGDLSAVYPAYQQRALPKLFIETGSIIRMLEAQSVSLDIGCQQLENLDVERIGGLFALSTKHYHLHSIVAGRITTQKTQQDSHGDAPTTDQGKLEALIKRCREKNILLSTEQGRLKFKAPDGAITPEIRLALKENKPALIEHLAQPSSSHTFSSHPAFRLTPIQLAYVMGRSPDFELGNGGSHYYAELECQRIDPVKLEIAINEIVIRHETLRTLVYSNGTQRVLEEVPIFRIQLHENPDEQALMAIRNQWSHHRYELGHWPMFSVQVSQLTNDVSRLHISFDLLMIDAWSGEMMLREIFKAYYDKPLSRPAFTFREYLEAEQRWLDERDGYRRRAEKYWDSRLEEMPDAPRLPVLREFQSVETPHYRRWRYALSGSEYAVLSAQAKKYHFTPSAVFCTAFMKALSGYSENKDLTLCLTLFNRLPINSEVPHILGDFTNVALVSYFHGKADTLLSEIDGTQKQLWNAVEHRTQNGIELLRKKAGDSPRKAIMPVVFTSLLFGETPDTAQGVLPEGLKEVYGITQTPQVAIDHQIYKRGGVTFLNWDVIEGVYDEVMLKALFNEYQQLIKAMVLESDWNRLFTLPHTQG
jgi:yersiniabactin nonribosomal peptide synthetase